MIHGQARVANVVLDIGSLHTFAGEAGDENPGFSSYSYLVEPHIHKKQQYQAGKQALDSQNYHKQIHSIFQKIGPQGKINKFNLNIDKFDKFVETILMDNLQLDNCSISLLIAEDISVELQPNEALKQRQKILDYLFQGMQLSNIAFIKKPVLSTFALGRSSAVVLDSGHSFSHCSIVQDGYCTFNKTVMFGGSLNHSMLKQDIQSKMKSGKKWTIPIQNSAQAFQESDIYFHKLVELETIIRNFPFVPMKSLMVSQVSEVNYTLPDGQKIKLNRNNIVDPFVNFPKFWEKYFKNAELALPSYLDDKCFYKVLPAYRGLQQMIYDTISQYLSILQHKNHTYISSNTGHDGKNKKFNQISEDDLLNNVMLAGGNMNFSDMSYQIEKGVRKRGGNVIEAPFQFNKDQEGNYCKNFNSLSWIGGSIACGLEIFNHFWIKLSEWKQFGSHLLTSKSIGQEISKGHSAQIQQNIRRNKKLQLISKKCA